MRRHSQDAFLSSYSFDSQFHQFHSTGQAMDPGGLKTVQLRSEGARPAPVPLALAPPRSLTRAHSPAHQLQGPKSSPVAGEGPPTGEHADPASESNLKARVS